MPRRIIPAVLFAIMLIPGVPGVAQNNDSERLQNWAQWRGPLATGEAPLGNPPIEWSEDQNIRWKTPIPGKGHSTPIVWNDRIFLTTAVPYGEKLNPPQPDTAPGAHDNVLVSQRHRFIVLAIDRASGEILWQKTLHESLPHEGGHYTASQASASCLADADFVYAYFGSHGLWSLDHDGNVQWYRDFGKLNTKHGHGEGSSPVLHGDTLVINRDHEGESMVVAINRITGRDIWKKQRREVTSWATPIVIEHDDRHQIIVPGTGRVRAYDLETGDVVWQCGGLSANIVASPVFDNGIVVVGSSYEIRSLFAISLNGAEGDITGTDHVLWQTNQRTPYVPSMLLYRDHVYFLRHYQGILTRLNLRTGDEPTGPFRLGSLRDIYASPVAASGRIYVTDLLGTTMVMTADNVPEMLARNRLDESVSASAAIAGNEIFLRGEHSLYCITDMSSE